MMHIHDDVMIWKRFSHYWPFVMGIHRSPIDAPHKTPVMLSFGVLFVVTIIHLLKSSRVSGDCRRHDANVTVTVMYRLKRKVNTVLHLIILNNGCYFADDNFECIFLNDIFSILITISSLSGLYQVMVWHRAGRKPLPPPNLAQLLDAIWSDYTTMNLCEFYQYKILHTAWQLATVVEIWAPSQYKDRLIYVWRFPC